MCTFRVSLVSSIEHIDAEQSDVSAKWNVVTRHWRSKWKRQINTLLKYSKELWTSLEETIWKNICLILHLCRIVVTEGSGSWIPSVSSQSVVLAIEQLYIFPWQHYYLLWQSCWEKFEWVSSVCVCVWTLKYVSLTSHWTCFVPEEWFCGKLY